MKCGILDYGTGNVQSVQNAFEHIGHSIIRSHDFDELKNTDLIIFPGQGAFGPAIEKLNKMKLIDPLQNYIKSKRPFIGICLGFQLLFNGSDEAPNHTGLNCFGGTFKQFKNESLSVPHMGWNSITATNTSSILDGFNDELFYFVHSYYLPINSNILGATTNYGLPFTSAIASNTQLITQFHPEKSGSVGLELLRQFIQSL